LQIGKSVLLVQVAKTVHDAAFARGLRFTVRFDQIMILQSHKSLVALDTIMGVTVVPMESQEGTYIPSVPESISRRSPDDIATTAMVDIVPNFDQKDRQHLTQTFYIMTMIVFNMLNHQRGSETLPVCSCYILIIASALHS